MKTNNYDIKLVYPYQDQQEILINEAFNKIDLLLNRGVCGFGINILPQNPNYGDLYIIATNPDVGLKQEADNVALYIDEWQFFKPNAGMIFWDNESDRLIVFAQNTWRPIYSLIN